MVSEHRAQERARDGAAEVRGRDQSETQIPRERQHPLPHRHVRDHVAREVRGNLRHAPATAGRAEPAPLARERDQVVQRATWAAHAPEAVREVAARDRGTQLALDVGRQGPASVCVDEAREEGLEVLAEHTMYDAARRIAPHDVGRARLVVIRGAQGAPDPGAARRLQPDRDRTRRRAVSPGLVETARDVTLGSAATTVSSGTTRSAHLACGLASRRRTADLRGRLRQDAVVMSAPDSIAWLLNIRGGDVPYTPLTLAFAVLHADASVELFIDPRKLTPGLREHLGEEVSVAAMEGLGPALDRLGADKKTVRIDPDDQRLIKVRFHGTPRVDLRTYENAMRAPFDMVTVHSGDREFSRTTGVM